MLLILGPLSILVLKDYIKHPSEILSVGDIIEVYVTDVNKEKGKVGLSLLKEV